MMRLAFVGLLLGIMVCESVLATFSSLVAQSQRRPQDPFQVYKHASSDFFGGSPVLFSCIYVLLSDISNLFFQACAPTALDAHVDMWQRLPVLLALVDAEFLVSHKLDSLDPCASIEASYLALAKGRQRSCWARQSPPPGINWTNFGPCSDDIYQHLPVLRTLAEEPGIEDILECGVEYGSSTTAFLSARPFRLHSVDVVRRKTLSRLEHLAAACGASRFKFLLQSSLEVKLHGPGALPIPDLLFIDTLHAGSVLSRELRLLGPSTRRYIVMHDTTLNAFEDEQHADFSPPKDHPPGLWPAVIDFLARQPEWFLALRCFNNNGLTVLRRSEGMSKDAEFSRKLLERVHCQTSLNHTFDEFSYLYSLPRHQLGSIRGLSLESFAKQTIKLALSFLRKGVPDSLTRLLWRDLVQCCAIMSHRVESGRPTTGMDRACEPGEVAMLGAELSRKYSLLSPLPGSLG